MIEKDYHHKNSNSWLKVRGDGKYFEAHAHYDGTPLVKELQVDVEEFLGTFPDDAVIFGLARDEDALRVNMLFGFNYTGIEVKAHGVMYHVTAYEGI